MQTRNKQRLLSQQPRTNAVQNASAAYTDTHLLPRKPSLPQQEVDRRKAISKIGGEYAQTPLFDKSVGILPLLNAPHLPGLPPPRLPMVAARMSQQRLAQREAATPQREPNASLLERREESKEESKAERPKKHHRVPTIFLTRGNNSPILREVLVEQAGWHEAVHREHANMCWLQAEMQKSAGWHSTGSLV